MKTLKFILTAVTALLLSANLTGQDQGLSRASDAAAPEVQLAHTKFLDSARVYRKRDLKKTLDYIAESMALITEAGNQDLWAKSLQALGDTYLYHRQPDLAIPNLEAALEIQYDTETAVQLGSAFLGNREYQKALDRFNAILNEADLVPYWQIEALEGKGDALLALGRHKEAIGEYNKALDIANTNGIGLKITNLNSKIAASYYADNKAEPAAEYYENTLESSKSLPTKRAVQEREKVADFYKKNNRVDDEIALRKESLDQLEQLEPAAEESDREIMEIDSISPQSINYKIANAYVAKNDYDQAIAYLKESLVQAGNDQDLVVQKDATKALSEVYRKKGDFSSALESYQQYVTLVDTLYARKERQISEATAMNVAILNQQNRIKGLEQERQLSESRYSLALTEQELIKESNKRQRWIIYSLVFGMLLTCLLAYFFYRNTQQQKLANNLLALKSLRTQMNPHFIFNALNSVNNYISRNDERSANAFISDFSGLMRAVLEHSESDFIPLSKEIELLSKYLKLEHLRFPEKFTYTLDVSEELDTEQFRIPPMLVQPYVENAIWHGLRYREGQGTLNITITQPEPDRVVIRIADDGIGRRKSAELKTENQVKKGSRAMENIERRIKIFNEMYPEKISVTVSDLDEDGSGTLVVLTLKNTKSR